MGRSKIPAKTPEKAPLEGSPLGMRSVRGIAAYKKAMGEGVKIGEGKARTEEGLLKTGSPGRSMVLTGNDEASRILSQLDVEKGKALLVKAAPPLDFLSDFSGEQLALLFRDESPAACAMVFSRLPPEVSATILANTSLERKTEIVRRIARLKEISPEVLKQTAGALREKARHFGRNDAEAGRGIDGKDVLAAILKHSDLAFGGRLLEELEENDLSLGREMKNRLYSLEDVVGAADRPLQEKLNSMDDREIALLLRDRSETFTRKILDNLSKARAARVREESEIMGTAPKVEAEAAVRAFLSWFRLGRENGHILMLSGEDVLL